MTDPIEREDVERCLNDLIEDYRAMAHSTAGHVLSSAIAAIRALPATPPAGEVEEDAALAYGNGYLAGLDDAKDQDAAALIKERDAAKTQVIFERALRQVAERRLNECRARVAQLEPLGDAHATTKDTEG